MFYLPALCNGFAQSTSDPPLLGSSAKAPCSFPMPCASRATFNGGTQEGSFPSRYFVFVHTHIHGFPRPISLS